MLREKPCEKNLDPFHTLVLQLSDVHDKQVSALRAENALLRNGSENVSVQSGRDCEATKRSHLAVNEELNPFTCVKKESDGSTEVVANHCSASKLSVTTGNNSLRLASICGNDQGITSSVEMSLEFRREIQLQGLSSAATIGRQTLSQGFSNADKVYEVSERWRIPQEIEEKIGTSAENKGSFLRVISDFGESAVASKLRKGRTTDRLSEIRTDENTTWTSETKGEYEDPGYCFIMSYPSSRPRLTWDVLGAVFIFYDIISIPMLEAFNVEQNEALERLDVAIMVFWLCDILASFCVGYVEEGDTIMEPRMVAKHYARTWLAPDILMVGVDLAAPWIQMLIEGIGAGQGGSSAIGLLRALRLIRMVRLVRLLKLRRVVGRIHDQVNSEYLTIVLDFVKLLLAVLILSHFTACVWYAIGRMEMGKGRVNWIEQVSLQDAEFDYQYATSLHYSLLAFTLESIIDCSNTAERWFTVVVTIFGIVGFSTILSRITSLMVQIQSMRTDTAKQFWLLRRFLRERRIPKNLAVRIERYLEFQTEKNSKVIQESQIFIFAQLSQQLATELRFELMVRSVTVHPFFDTIQKVNDVTMHRICATTLQRMSFAIDDPVFFRAEASNVTYFVSCGKLGYDLNRDDAKTRHGSAVSWKPLNKDGSNVRIIREKEWLCEPCLWTSWRHQGDCFAHTEVDLLSLDASQFAEVVQSNPRVWYFASKYAFNFVEVLNDTSSPSDVAQGATPVIPRIANIFKRRDSDFAVSSDSVDAVLSELSALNAARNSASSNTSPKLRSDLGPDL